MRRYRIICDPDSAARPWIVQGDCDHAGYRRDRLWLDVTRCPTLEDAQAYVDRVQRLQRQQLGLA